jgi:sugar/nucleoside kinase (ribokinase family)
VPSLDEIVFMLEPSRFPTMRQQAAAGVPLGGLTGADVRRLADRLITMGAAIVMIKLGDQGAYLQGTPVAARLRACGRAAPPQVAAWAGAACYAPCFAVNVAGTTGSGDCTIAGLLAALAQGTGPDEAICMAAATGAASVEKPDATSGVPSWSALAARVASGWPRRRAAVTFDT